MPINNKMQIATTILQIATPKSVAIQKKGLSLVKLTCNVLESRRIATHRDTSRRLSRHIISGFFLDKKVISRHRDGNRDVGDGLLKQKVGLFKLITSTNGGIYLVFQTGFHKKCRDVAIQCSVYAVFSSQNRCRKYVFKRVAIASQCVAIRDFVSRFGIIWRSLWFLV
jgi:hypothetical protein